MLPKTFLLALVAALAAAAPVTDAVDDEAEAQANNCQKAHIIGARGSHPENEQCGGGPGNLPEITNRVHGATVSFVQYPAALPQNICGETYSSSRKKGIQNMRKQIHNHVQKCKDKSRIVLLGYSQGAQVVTDLLSGGSDTGEPALDDRFRKYLKAVVLVANNSQVPKAKYNVGLPGGQGNQPIPHPKKVASLGKKVVSYCKQGDNVCGVNKPPFTDIHEREVDIWQQEAAKFINKRI